MQLIFEYRNNDVLWHSRHNAFYNSSRKELIWNEIAEKLMMDVDDVKKKIESLRGSYRREKNREKKSILKGKGMIIIKIKIISTKRNYFFSIYIELVCLQLHEIFRL